ncbi:unnamed protein product [Pseudo-nitzschia multistriata]|uniref:Uncharacterized protein n=1 Tax=Pseudo-nitzschia multistriata TaxID=183589 RepID=A0A448ZTN1_9STRA|nr:unnamed protein product [Pseudo-nitzschia multistriata]
MCGVPRASPPLQSDAVSGVALCRTALRRVALRRLAGPCLVLFASLRFRCGHPSRSKGSAGQKGLEHVQGDLRLVGRHHVPPVDDLQKGQPVAGPGHPGPAAPVVGPGGSKVLLVGPVQVLRPGLVAQVVADKVDVAGVDERRKAGLQQVGDVAGKVLHPVGPELGVDPKVAGLPPVAVGLVHSQGLLGRFEVEPGLDVRKVVAERGDLALFANVVGVEARGLVGRGEAEVAGHKGRLAGKGVDGVVPLVALVDELCAGRDRLLHCVVDALVDDLDAVGVVPDHLGVPRVLLLGGRKAVSDGQAGKVEGDAVVAQVLVALPDAVRNGGDVVSPVGFPDDVEGVLRVLGVLLDKGLEEVVGVLSHHFFAAVVLVSVGKADARRLVQPQNVRGLGPAVGVDGGALAVGIDAAGSVFGEEGQGARATRSAGQPDDEGDLFVLDRFRTRSVPTLFEHPEKEVLVPALVVLSCQRPWFGAFWNVVVNKFVGRPLDIDQSVVVVRWISQNEHATHNKFTKRFSVQNQRLVSKILQSPGAGFPFVTQLLLFPEKLLTQRDGMRNFNRGICLTHLGSLQVHVPANGFARGVAKISAFLRTLLQDGFSQLVDGAALQPKVVDPVAVRIARGRGGAAVKDAGREALGFLLADTHGGNGRTLAPHARGVGAGCHGGTAFGLGFYVEAVRFLDSVAGSSGGSGAEAVLCRRE